jgi:hypothetical protein
MGLYNVLKTVAKSGANGIASGGLLLATYAGFKVIKWVAIGTLLIIL